LTLNAGTNSERTDVSLGSRSSGDPIDEAPIEIIQGSKKSWLRRFLNVWGS